MPNRRHFLATLMLALGLFATPASAQSISTHQAARFISDLGDRAIEILSKPDLSKPELEREFRSMFREAFYVPSIGRFVLGRYWRIATPEQRTEFLGLFEDFVVETYSARFLAAYSGQKFKVKDVQQASDREAVVMSEVIDPNGPPIRVDWRVGTVKDQYRILDVIVEGVSMAVTQRSEFASIIQRSGGRIDGLLAMLRERTSSLAPRAAKQ